MNIKSLYPCTPPLCKQTYQMALAQGLGGENKGAMIKAWENALDVKARKRK